ncbi:MAG: AAA family ATPase [Gammaproteobacteria bacterium]|nr:AAA family ATPase [Gammaproteobacteria bacterium]
MNRQAAVTESESRVTEQQRLVSVVLDQLNEIILGKDHQLRLAISCLLARGHLLIEDLPGVGKTTLAHALARTLGLNYNRIQFTSDLLPADIIGVSVYLRDDNRFEFHPGPIFSQLVLADEVNRATPKAQSALLEAMEESQVTADGDSYPLPDPFFVIATQNPVTQIGTYPLPESQLDRFLMRISLGFPSPDMERRLISGQDRRELLSLLEPALQVAQLQSLMDSVSSIHVSDVLLDYVQALVAFTRESPDFINGLSPRAAISIVSCSRAWAMIHGHPGVLPEDVQAIIPAVANHRMRLRDELQASTEPGELMLAAVSVP